MRARWALLGAMALSILPAAAEAKSSILALELEVKGLPPDLRALFDRAMREEIAATAPDADLLPKPVLDFEGMKLAAGCADEGPRCLAVIGETLGAGRVFQASITGSAQRARLYFVLVDVKSGKSRPTTAEMSEIDEESIDELRIHVAAAFGVKKTPPDGGIALLVTSDIGKLEGAEILLDDHKVQRAALSRVSPGQRRLEIRQAGFETVVWVGRVRPGKTTQVPVAFKPLAGPPTVAETPLIPTQPEPVAEPEIAPPPPPPPAVVPSEPEVPTERPPRIATWILAGGTVVAAGVATIFGVQTLGAHDDLDKMKDVLSSDCVGCRENVCDADAPPAACDDFIGARLRTNITWGVAAGLGVAAVAAFFLEGDRDTPAMSGGITPTGDGASASFSLRF